MFCEILSVVQDIYVFSYVHIYYIICIKGKKFQLRKH
nr:MAG TPA: hypothetical protein [Caudoviricetes sp.]